jgi:hypothetical protein
LLPIRGLAVDLYVAVEELALDLAAFGIAIGNPARVLVRVLVPVGRDHVLRYFGGELPRT